MEVMQRIRYFGIFMWLVVFREFRYPMPVAKGINKYAVKINRNVARASDTNCGESGAAQCAKLTDEDVKKNMLFFFEIC